MYTHELIISLCKTQQVVKKLDIDGNGFMTVDEVKVLISIVTKTPAEKIPDDHPEVQESCLQCINNVQYYRRW